MGRRIEVELTSNRDDGSWTWRAAGAKKPKGMLDGSVLYEGAKVGDVVKADAEYHVDGIEITEVMAPAAKKQRTNILEMKHRELRDDELVTTQRVKKNDRGRGRDRSSGRGDGRRGDRKRGDGRRSNRPPRDDQPQRPKPKRLRAKRHHREALLSDVGVEHRPILERLLRDGMPGVRAAIEKQNAEAKEAGKPEVDTTPILAIAENNVSKARLAEWRDKADAALKDIDELDLRDLRSVVVSGADLAKEDDRELVEQLKSGLDRRVESDHQAWVSDLDTAVGQERVIRALRLSSRPVKAGAPLPAETATKLAAQVASSLTIDVSQDRWGAILDALAFSPVRSAVTPESIPSEPKEALLTDVRRLSDRIPAIAELFGINPADVPKSAKRRRPQRKRSNKKKTSDGKPSGASKPQSGRRSEKKPTPVVEEPTPVVEEPTPVVEEPLSTPTASETEIAGSGTAAEVSD